MALDSKISWVVNGRLTHVIPAHMGTVEDENSLLQRSGIIKITESADGVEIKWPVFAGNWSSLFFLMEWVHTRNGPFKLVYFLSGWFQETCQTSEQAAKRISEIQSKSDVHITSHTFVKQMDPKETKVPHVLRDALKDQVTIPDLSVDCAFDDMSNRFVVERVGTASTFAKYFGMNLVSFPCLYGHSYDQAVSEAYQKVLKTEEPVYDHVLAAMDMPKEGVVWLPYQRVILPHKFPDGRPGVTVITEVSDVDISIL